MSCLLSRAVLNAILIHQFHKRVGADKMVKLVEILTLALIIRVSQNEMLNSDAVTRNRRRGIEI